MVEFGVAVSDAARAIGRGQRPALELALLLSRVFVGVGLRELLVISGAIDVTRGLPIVHINFVGYDEQAHRRGPGSRFAHFGLRGIDRAIRKIAAAANRSRRRDYTVWIFSDHGQERTRAFPAVNPGGIEAVLARALTASQQELTTRVRIRVRPDLAAPWLSSRSRRRSTPERADEKPEEFQVAAMGPVGHVYFAREKSDEERLALARKLVDEEHMPGVLVPRKSQAGLVWLHARGETAVPDGVAALLPHQPAIAAEIANDLGYFCGIPDAGDLILLGWSPWGDAWSFAEESGAHGGFGPEETCGFVIVPAHTPLPAGAEHFLRPSTLRTAARYHLGREPLTVATVDTPAAGRLRMMTYNVHSCGGMDGRVSPHRVARAIAEQAPDVVALQELDLGRRRSRAEDQAAIIARQLGMHLAFCPTVTVGEEHYGHALLSRWPVEIVKRAKLPEDPRSWWREPRSLLWVQVTIGAAKLHVVTAHLGLGPRERVLQMKFILGDECLGALPPDEPVLLCGDFNLTPGSEPYRLAAGRLRDVQITAAQHRPRATFSSLRPFLRLDHMFISAQLAVERVWVPRNALTRVASDHLPLLAELSIAPAAAETTTRTPP
jgi:endonuclease/exonuclease/phosphatase family metal-dependent hydrolase